MLLKLIWNISKTLAKFVCDKQQTYISYTGLQTYPSFLLKVLPASESVSAAIIIRGIIFVITSASPIPFKNIPLVSTIKNLTGFSHVKYCRKTGMSSIGEINPDNSTEGIINVIACHGVEKGVEIYPFPFQTDVES